GCSCSFFMDTHSSSGWVKRPNAWDRSIDHPLYYCCWYGWIRCPNHFGLKTVPVLNYSQESDSGKPALMLFTYQIWLIRPFSSEPEAGLIVCIGFLATNVTMEVSPTLARSTKRDDPYQNRRTHGNPFPFYDQHTGACRNADRNH